MNNNKLKKSHYSPSNCEIAKLLGLKPRTVSFYLAKIRRNAEENKENEN